MFTFDVFRLLSVELNNAGGLTASYTIALDDDPVEYKVKALALPHPDLKCLLENLGERVTFILGFPPEAKEVIHCTGVSFPSAGKVVYHALVHGPMGAYSVKCPKLHKLNDDEAKVLEELEKEVYRYLMEGKSAQLTIFGDDTSLVD